jgi:hypothetical protein
VDDARHWPAVLERDSSHFFQNFEKTSCALLNLGIRDQFSRKLKKVNAHKVGERIIESMSIARDSI